MKTIFAFVFFVAFLAPFSNTAFAQPPKDKEEWLYQFYERWVTLFGDPLAPVSRDNVKNREISGLAYKGPGSNNSVDTSTGSLVKIQKVDLLISLDKSLSYQKEFTYNDGIIDGVDWKNIKDFSNIFSSDFYKNYPHRVARYINDMVGDTPGPSKGSTSFVIRTKYVGTDNKEHEIFTPIATKNDSTAKSNIESTSFIMDYGENSSEVIKQSIIQSVDFGTGDTAAKPGTTTTFDFWYCGGVQERVPTEDDNWVPGYFQKGTTPDVNTQIRSEYKDRVAFFKDLCGGTAYYKIGQTIQQQLPSTMLEVTQQQESNSDLSTGTTRNNASGTLPSCGLLPWQGGSIMGCVAQVLYYGVFIPISFIAGLLGNLFDFFLGYSLSDQSYRHDFIQSSWQLVRDISNIFFIILMIWSGLAVVFGIGKVSYKQVVPALIINALLINFSLFATRVVVDISNITARLFYNQMTVKVDGQIRDIGISGFKPISESIVSAFNPQRIFENSTVLNQDIVADDNTPDEGVNSAITFNGGQNVAKTATGMTRDSNDYASYFALVTLMAALIMWGVAMMFWKTAFIFVGRVIGIYIAMIFSPFAFLSRSIPVLGALPISWSSWWSELSKYAIVAPIFLFFLYIINAFLGVKFFTELGIAQADGLFGKVMYILIPMLIIYGLMDQAVGVAKQFAGKTGSMIQNAIQGTAGKALGLAGGVALGVATGGVALAGRSLAAKAALSAETRASLEAKKAAGGFSGRWASLRLGTDKKLQTSSFDARNTGAFKGMTNAFGKEGIKFNDPLSGKFGMGTDDTKGGLKAAQKKEKEKLKKQIESINVDASVDEKKVKEIWAKKSADLVLREQERLSNASVDDLAKAHKEAGKTDEEIELMKTNNTLKENLAELAKSKVASDYGDVKNNKQLTRALRQEFAQTIGEGRTFGQQMAPLNIAGGIIGASGLAAAVGTGVLPVVGGVAMDASRAESEKRKNANKAFDDAKKNRKKLPKQERLEKEKKEIETELEEMDGYVESIQDTLKKHFQTIIDEANAGNEDFKKFKNRTVDSFDTKPEDKREALLLHKDIMQADLESKDMEIKQLNSEYQKAKEAGQADKMTDIETKKNKAVIQKSRMKRNIDNLDEGKRARKERDLASKEGELEKIETAEENKKKPKEKEGTQ